MSIAVKAPRLGEGVDELALGHWLVREGDIVKLNEPILELESDKVVTELPSPAAGCLLKIIAKEGSLVHVGDILAFLGEAGEHIADPATTDPATTVLAHTELASATFASTTLATAVPDSPSAPSPKRFLSPLARKLSALHGVDPALIRGTGLGGRVMKQDILDFIAARDEQKGGPTLPLREPQPHSTARMRIAQRMLESQRISAPVLTVMEADLGTVIAHRTANKESYALDKVRLTLSAYFVVATARALRASPLMNASWTDAGMIVHPSINIGVAVSLGDDGLLVPVVRNADTLPLKECARVIDDLASRTRSHRLLPEEVQGGTFTLTNHGTSGSLFATPIIVQPQVGILGIGAVHKRVIVVETSEGQDAMAIRPMAYLSFVFDHRVTDGEGADRFLSKVKYELENWS
jgi:2-oxoglutarate dehydrogenase E2 component (dihydrolipoamide succinyltransferase)